MDVFYLYRSNVSLFTIALRDFNNTYIDITQFENYVYLFFCGKNKINNNVIIFAWYLKAVTIKIIIYINYFWLIKFVHLLEVVRKTNK